MTNRIESPEALRRLEVDQAARRRIGEQAFQVEHYLAYWKCYPTPANWRRVIDAAEAYDPIPEPSGPEAVRRYLRTGKRLYYTFERSGGRSGSNRTALGRCARVGSRGRIYEQTFRKGSRTWTVAR